ncbi:hypothetical protein GCM10007932_47980 [Vibrio penaeicida]|uniref:Uncharacterized protein n=1 Tax=Vibrio penaeicida TaxID=104609 RepID=A0AAV5NZK5_9VIBR|nr:hypothetical protein GCM10007932_47980 [Vibrio penaeicida]
MRNTLNKDIDMEAMLLALKWSISERVITIYPELKRIISEIGGTY